MTRARRHTRPHGRDAKARTTRTAADLSSTPVYAAEGPFTVGVSTLHLPDRLVEVWYPAAPGSGQGKPLATYKALEQLPSDVREFVPVLDHTITMPAYRDVPPHRDGPFPVLLFSHGLGAFRLVNANLVSGIASWGFVVAAPDHRERGLEALMGLSPKEPEREDIEVLLATLQLLKAEHTRSDSPLRGLIDAGRVAASGHSAGGGAALALLNEPAISAAVGYAVAPKPMDTPPAKPTLLIAAAEDLVITPELSMWTYRTLPPPKRFVMIDRIGHNTFTDSCVMIREMGGLSATGLPIPDIMIRLGENGCTPENLAAEEAWAIIQHFTLAHLRDALGIDKGPVGLGKGIAQAFPVTVTYLEEERVDSEKGGSTPNSERRCPQDG